MFTYRSLCIPNRSDDVSAHNKQIFAVCVSIRIIYSLLICGTKLDSVLHVYVYTVMKYWLTFVKMKFSITKIMLLIVLFASTVGVVCCKLS